MATAGQTNMPSSQDPVPELPPQHGMSTIGQFELGSDGVGTVVGSQEWPSEILDSMTWSAQFFDAVCNAALSPFDQDR